MGSQYTPACRIAASVQRCIRRKQVHTCKERSLLHDMRWPCVSSSWSSSRPCMLVPEGGCLIWLHPLQQGSLQRVGLDASAAIARARTRSASRMGRKRERSAAGVADMDVDAAAAAAADGSLAPPAKKRIHSSKARCAGGSRPDVALFVSCSSCSANCSHVRGAVQKLVACSVVWHACLRNT